MGHESAEPLERRDFEAAALMAAHPPVWRDRNKRVVYDIACPVGTTSEGRLHYSRWAEMALPETVDPGRAVEIVEGRPGYFDYVPIADPKGAVEWHVNFADPHLFVAYGSSLFAQDEMQVAEHPILGSLREALLAEGQTAATVWGGQATPVSVMGAERRCRIETDPNPAEGRPSGLYGNAFARAPADVVARATTRLDPPTITNMIAMAAPSGGSGRYRTEVIGSVLSTAFTGFRAAAAESRRAHGGEAQIIVHAGYWGCGAFGGNRVLMALLQALAAEMAGLDRLVFHTGGPGGQAPLNEGLAILRDHPPPVETRAIIERVEAQGFEWGVGDGN